MNSIIQFNAKGLHMMADRITAIIMDAANSSARTNRPKTSLDEKTKTCRGARLGNPHVRMYVRLVLLRWQERDKATRAMKG